MKNQSVYRRLAAFFLCLLFCSTDVLAQSAPSSSRLLKGQANLDLTSTQNTLPAAHLLKSGQVLVKVGNQNQAFTPASLLTPGENLAVYQVLSSGRQSIQLGPQGNATGGSFTIGAKFTQFASSLVIPSGVTAIKNFATNSTMELTGNFTNLGTFYAISNNQSITNAIVRARDITNGAGALFSTSLPASFKSEFGGTVSRLNLTLNAGDNFTNAGSIVSSGNLNVTAGNTLTNYGSLIATNNLNITAGRVVNQSLNNSPAVMAAQVITVNTLSGNLVNSGLMQATGALNISSASGVDLVVNNTGGILQSVSGAMNIRNTLYEGSDNTKIMAGKLQAEELNINGGNGTVDINVEKLDGRVNIKAVAAHVYADTPVLTLGSVCAQQDPTYVNTGGDIDINGPVTAGENLAILASGNIVGTSVDASISTANSNGNGYNVTLIAGANITCTGCANSSAIPSGSNPLSSTQAASVDLSSGSGGNIDFTSNTGTKGTIIDTQATGNGGNVTLVARANSGNGGHVLIPQPNSGYSIYTGGGGSNYSNGDITIIAGAGSGTAVQSGSLQAQNAGASGGNISIYAAQPTASDAQPLNFNYQGNQISNNSLAYSSANQADIILTGTNSASGFNVSTAGTANLGTVTTSQSATLSLSGTGTVSGTVNTTGEVTMSLGNTSVILGTNAGAITVGNGSSTLSIGPTAQSIQSLSIQTNGSITNTADISIGNTTTGLLTLVSTGSNITLPYNLTAGAGIMIQSAGSLTSAASVTLTSGSGPIMLSALNGDISLPWATIASNSGGEGGNVFFIASGNISLNNIFTNATASGVYFGGAVLAVAGASASVNNQAHTATVNGRSPGGGDITINGTINSSAALSTTAAGGEGGAITLVAYSESAGSSTGGHIYTQAINSSSCGYGLGSSPAYSGDILIIGEAAGGTTITTGAINTVPSTLTGTYFYGGSITIATATPQAPVQIVCPFNVHKGNDEILYGTFFGGAVQNGAIATADLIAMPSTSGGVALVVGGNTVGAGTYAIQTGNIQTNGQVRLLAGFTTLLSPTISYNIQTQSIHGYPTGGPGYMAITTPGSITTGALTGTPWFVAGSTYEPNAGITITGGINATSSPTGLTLIGLGSGSNISVSSTSGPAISDKVDTYMIISTPGAISITTSATSGAVITTQNTVSGHDGGPILIASGMTSGQSITISGGAGNNINTLGGGSSSPGAAWVLSCGTSTHTAYKLNSTAVTPNSNMDWTTLSRFAISGPATLTVNFSNGSAPTNFSPGGYTGLNDTNGPVQITLNMSSFGPAFQTSLPIPICVTGTTGVSLLNTGSSITEAITSPALKINTSMGLFAQSINVSGAGIKGNATSSTVLIHGIAANCGNVNLNINGPLQVTTGTEIAAGSFSLTANGAMSVCQIAAGGAVSLATSAGSNGAIALLRIFAPSLSVSADGSGVITCDTTFSPNAIRTAYLTLSSGSGDIGTSTIPLSSGASFLTINTTGNVYINNWTSSAFIGSSTVGALSWTETVTNTSYITAGASITATGIAPSGQAGAIVINSHYLVLNGSISATNNNQIVEVLCDFTKVLKLGGTGTITTSGPTIFQISGSTSLIEFAGFNDAMPAHYTISGGGLVNILSPEVQFDSIPTSTTCLSASGPITIQPLTGQMNLTIDLGLSRNYIGLSGPAYTGLSSTSGPFIIETGSGGTLTFNLVTGATAGNLVFSGSPQVIFTSTGSLLNVNLSSCVTLSAQTFNFDPSSVLTPAGTINVNFSGSGINNGTLAGSANFNGGIGTGAGTVSVYLNSLGLTATASGTSVLINTINSLSAGSITAVSSSLILQSANNIDIVGSSTAAGTVSLFAGTAPSSFVKIDPTIGVTGANFAVTTQSFNNQGTLIATGTSSGDNISISSSGGQDLTISAAGLLTVSSSGNSLILNSSSGNIIIASSTAVTGGTIVLTTGQSFLNVTVPAGITVTAPTVVFDPGSTSSPAGTINLNYGGSGNNNGTIAGNVSFNGGSGSGSGAVNVYLSSITGTASASGSSITINTTSPLTTGALTSAGALNLQSAGSLDLTDNSSAQASVVLTSGASPAYPIKIEVGKTIQGKNILITTQTLNNLGSLLSTGSSSGDNIVLNSASGQDLNITSGGTLTLTYAGNSAVFSSSSGNINFSNISSITGGSLVLTSAASTLNITMSSGSSLTAPSINIYPTSTSSPTGTININFNGKGTNNGQITGTLTLNGGQSGTAGSINVYLSSLSGSANAYGSSITINTSGALNLSAGTIDSSHGDVNLSAGGDFSLSGASVQSHTGSVSLNATGTLALSNCPDVSSNGGNILITSAKKVTISSTAFTATEVTSGGAIGIYAGKGFNLAAQLATMMKNRQYPSIIDWTSGKPDCTNCTFNLSNGGYLSVDANVTSPVTGAAFNLNGGVLYIDPMPAPGSIPSGVVISNGVTFSATAAAVLPPQLTAQPCSSCQTVRLLIIPPYFVPQAPDNGLIATDKTPPEEPVLSVPSEQLQQLTAGQVYISLTPCTLYINNRWQDNQIQVDPGSVFSLESDRSYRLFSGRMLIGTKQDEVSVKLGLQGGVARLKENTIAILDYESGKPERVTVLSGEEPSSVTIEAGNNELISLNSGQEGIISRQTNEKEQLPVDGSARQALPTPVRSGLSVSKNSVSVAQLLQSEPLLRCCLSIQGASAQNVCHNSWIAQRLTSDYHKTKFPEITEKLWPQSRSNAEEPATNSRLLDTSGKTREVPPLSSASLLTDAEGKNSLKRLSLPEQPWSKGAGSGILRSGSNLQINMITDRHYRLVEGAVLISARKAIFIDTAQASITCKTGASVLLSASNNITRIYDLNDRFAGDVTVQTEYKSYALTPGSEMSIVKGLSRDAALRLVIAEKMARRRMQLVHASNDTQLFANDFSIIDALQRSPLLADLSRCADPTEKRLFVNLMKTAAALSLSTDGTHGAFSRGD